MRNKCNQVLGVYVWRSLMQFFGGMAVLVLCLAAPCEVFAADVNVLILGSAYDYEGGGFDPAPIKTQFQNILNGANVGSVNVTLEATKGYDNYYNNLSAWFHNPTGDLDRWANLRGERGTNWNYVVILCEPSTLETLPGQYAQGVATIANEVAKGSAKTVLLMQWPKTTNATINVNYYKEVTYRVGRTSRGCLVAPAGLAWQAAGSPTGSTHPTTAGAYIAAATLYSTLWGKSATNSTYSYNATMANTAFDTVNANNGIPQYSGKFSPPSNINPIYKSLFNQGREVGIACYQSSTEVLLQGMAITLRQNDYFLNSGPSSLYIERFDGWMATTYMAFGFVFVYGDNAGYASGVGTELGYYARSARDYSNTSSKRNGRQVPLQLMWCQFRQLNRTLAPIDQQHLNKQLQTMNGAFMLTEYSGRCPMTDAQADTTDPYWTPQRIAYETAWRMSTLQGRAPGFKTLPSTVDRYTVDPAAPETMKVLFTLPLETNVTVTVTTSEAFASVSPQTLTFTPENYGTPQYVTVNVEEGSTPGDTFDVIYRTSSDDEVCSGLKESWAYRVNRRPVANAQSIEAYLGHLRYIKLTGSDADGESIRYTVTQLPAHGTLFQSGANVGYTPDAGYLGPDSFKFVTYDRSADSISEEATITISVVEPPKFGFNLIDNGSAELYPFTSNRWTNVAGSWVYGRSGIGAKDGSGQFIAASNFVEMYQDVDLSTYAQDIIDGKQFFKFDSWIYSAGELAHIIVESRNASGQILSSRDSGYPNSASYIQCGWNITPPTNTTTFRVRLISQIVGTGDNMSAFDALSLTAKSFTNIAPVADSQINVQASAGVTNTLTLTGSDADDDPLTFIIIQQPQYGTVTVNGTGPTVSYVPNAGYLGPDIFTFKANDERDDSNVASVRVNVVGNVEPSIVMDSPAKDLVAIPYNVGLLLETTVVDDGNPSPLALTWRQVSGPGAATILSPTTADTAVTFHNIFGTYVFELTADDGELTAVKRVTVKVGYYDQSNNQGPHVLCGNAYAGLPNTDIDLDGATIGDDGLPNPPGKLTSLWSVVSGPGDAVIANGLDLSTTINCATSGVYTLRLSVDDGEMKTFNDVILQVSGTGNLAPVAENQTVSVDMNSTSNVITLAATDAEGDARVYSVVTAPLHGTLSGTAPNLTYTPNAGFGGNDSFTFKANDGQDSNIATVTIKVKVAPVVDAGRDRTVYASIFNPGPPESYSAVVNLDGTVTDANGDAVTSTWSVVSGTATFGSATAVDTTATFPAPGTNTLRLTASDGTFQVANDVTITVLPVDVSNAAPIAASQSVTVDRNSSGKIITLSATDAENDPLTYSIVRAPTNGTLSGTAPNLTYKPKASFSGTDSFTFTASDVQRPSAAATVTITVNTAPEVNAGPDQTVTLSSIVMPWTPAELTTAAWYDAANDVTITASGGAVSKWADKSGNNRHATQSTASKQPSTGATIGSRNALSFSGDVLNTPLTQLTTVSMYIVMDPNPLAGGGDLGPIGAAAAYNSGGLFMALGISGTTARYSIYYGASLASASRFVNGVAGANHSFDPAIFSHSGASLSTEGLKYKIGTSYANETQGFAGKMGEIIICSAVHDVATRQKIEGYLAHKWGLVENLPADHPYKNAAPTFQGTGGVADLAGTVNDADNDTYSTRWSVVNAPGRVSFSNDVSLVSPVTFRQAGLHTLRLTANDALKQSTDDVLFNVIDGTSTYHTVTASVGTGGTIAPGGQIMVREGTNQTFSITANTGYAINDVVVDGLSVGATNLYTFSNVSTQHTIAASFAIKQYTVTFDVGAYGTRSGGGELVQWVNHGSVASAPTVTPAANYRFVGWDAYLGIVTSALTIHARYEQIIQHTLTYQAGANGHLNGVIAQTVEHGFDGSAVTAIPDTGYRFARWSDDSTANPRVENNVSADVTVTAIFAIDLVVVSNQGATAVDSTSATISGKMISGTAGSAWLCWGAADGGKDSTSTWDNVVSVGAVTEGVAFSTLVTGLSTNTTYFYRCYAVNSYGSDWSDTAATFSGTPVSGVTSWTPADITVSAWFDAADTGTITASAGRVSQWNDKSGQGRNATQNTAADQPKTGGSINGINAITGYESTGLPYMNVSGSATIRSGFAVAKVGSTVTSKIIIVGARTISAIDNEFFVRKQPDQISFTGSSTTTGKFRLNGGTESASVPRATDTTTVGSGNPFLIQGTFDSATTLGAIIGRTGTVGPTTADFVGEIIWLAGVPSTSNRQKIEGYLAHKWSLTSKLPAGHPYKSENPVVTNAIANRPTTGISDSTATFNASLNAIGTNYAVTVYYGTTDGGTNAGSWTSSVAVGSWTNVSTNVSYAVSGLSAEATYRYTFMASNATETVWASPSWTFTTPGAPETCTLTVNSAHGTAVPAGVSQQVSNSVVNASIIDSPVLIGSNLYTCTGWIGTGSTTGGSGTSVSFTMTNATTLTWIWQTNTLSYTLTYLAGANGSISGTTPQTVAYGASGTAVTPVPTTGYHFVNWSDSSTANPRTDTGVTNDITVTANFAINPVPVVSSGAGATALSSTSATLQGVLTTGEIANVWICWGVADGGTSTTGAWDHVISMGAVTEGVAFSNLVTGLSTNTTYFYRCYATNVYGSDWSDTAATFSGTPVGGFAFWTPAKINTKAWYDSADTSTITQSAGAVSQWNDKSGNGKHAVQTTSARRPSYQSNDAMVNGLPSIGNGGATGQIGLDVPSISAKTVYVVTYYKDGVDTTFDGYATLFSGPGANGQYRVMGTTNSADLIATYNFNDAGTYKNGSATSSTTVLGMGASVLKLKASALRTQSWALGYNQLVADRDWQGAYCEVIFTEGTEDAATEAKIEGYLAHKWNLQAKLPANHPYKSAPPSDGRAIDNLAPSAFSETAATLNASLAAVGTNYAVTVYYGTTDGGTNATLWTSSVAVGSWTNVSTNVSYAVSGLAAGTTYRYTFMASNAMGRVWATPSWTFTTPAAAQLRTVTVNHAVPYMWLSAQNAAWAADYEAAVTNDVDGDGFTTWQEYWAGTDPLVNASHLKIDSITVEGANTVIKWQHAAVGAGVPPLAIQATTNLNTGPWVNVGFNAPTNGINLWSGTPGSQQLFYKIAVTNAP